MNDRSINELREKKSRVVVKNEGWWLDSIFLKNFLTWNQILDQYFDCIFEFWFKCLQNIGSLFESFVSKNGE